MKERFEGKKNRAQLIAALKQQIIVESEDPIAEAFADAGSLVEFKPGKAFITQDATVQDVFLILMGNAAIRINGAQTATRQANEHVGEMVVVDPTLPRSATVVALDTVVALKVDGAKFRTICDTYRRTWERIARVLARRLYQRNSTIFVPNKKPRVFVISSLEGRYVAEAVQKKLASVADVKVWYEDVFFAGGFTVETLEQELVKADFAIAVATPDDRTKKRGKTSMAVRDNVIFELGLFMGKLTRFRAFLFHPSFKTFSAGTDFNGLTAIRYPKGRKADIDARVTSACNEVRKLIKLLGVRRFEFENR
jgi:predicted nucleotide-binding protein